VFVCTLHPDDIELAPRSKLAAKSASELDTRWRRVGGAWTPLSGSRPERHIYPMGQPAFDFRLLPIPDRLQLVEDIWDSIAQEANMDATALPISVVQRTELERRLRDADAEPDASIPWEQVRTELFERGG